jgi:serine/threonine protein kinase
MLPDTRSLGGCPKGRERALLYMTQSASTGERRVIKISDLNRVNAEFGALEEFNCPQVVKACLKDELTITSWDDDLAKIPQTAFFMMEFLDGEEIIAIVVKAISEARIRNENIVNPIIDPKEVVDQMFKLCEALLPFWLKGYFHGDIKPENIIHVPERGWVLYDFLVGALYECGVLNNNRGGGSAGYMLPELFSMKQDYKRDLFSVGISMTRIITGFGINRYFKVFGRTNLPDDLKEGYGRMFGDDLFSNPLIPVPLQAFIKTVSHQNPEKRISDPNLFLKELGEVRRKLFAG